MQAILRFLISIDYLVTTVSTIALEFACFGKRPLICGKTGYSGYGFTKEPKTLKEYFINIKNLDYENILSARDKLNAQRIYYFLDNFANQKFKIK